MSLLLSHVPDLPSSSSLPDSFCFHVPCAPMSSSASMIPPSILLVSYLLSQTDFYTHTSMMSCGQTWQTIFYFHLPESVSFLPISIHGYMNIMISFFFTVKCWWRSKLVHFLVTVNTAIMSAEFASMCVVEHRDLWVYAQEWYSGRYGSSMFNFFETPMY